MPVSLISTLPMSTVDGEITLAQQISQLPGIAQVLVYGAQKYAFAGAGRSGRRGAQHSMEDIRTVVSKTNSNTPVGTMVGDLQNTLTLRGDDARPEYRKVVVAYRNGSPIKLDEVARVVDSVENDQIASLFNNERAIVPIQRQPDANTVSVVDSARGRAVLPRRFRPPSPAVLNDRSIRSDSVADVQETLLSPSDS